MKRQIHCVMVIMVGLIVPFDLAGQDKQGYDPLIKLGVWFSHNRVSSQNKYTLNLEFEKAFAKVPFLSQGIAVYTKLYSPQSTYENLSIGYQLKVYPFYGLKKHPYNGLYLGTGVSYVFKINPYDLTGPGVKAMIGYQRMIKDKLLIGFEFGQTYMKNFNSEGPFSKHSYFINSVFLNMGIKLHTKKVEN